MTHHGRYLDWLQNGLQADMRYLESSFHVNTRQNPENLYPGLRSIIVVGLTYPLHHSSILEDETVGAISGYAAGEDYHLRVPHLLEPLLAFIADMDPNAPTPRVFTDSAPILERELAVRAGLGWIGRNACLVTPTHGSNILLAEVFTGLPLQADTPFTADLCGTCNRCLEACPTGCILPDREIDANRCLSYHTIENRGSIPEEIMEKIGVWIFGCDICQMVCPWNRQTRHKTETQELAERMSVEEMLGFLESSSTDFKNEFSRSAISRARYSGLMRNIMIRLANLKDRRAIKLMQVFMNASCDPVLQQTARWAAERIQQ